MLFTLYPRQNIWRNNIHSVRGDEILPPAVNLPEKRVWCSGLRRVPPIVVRTFSTLCTQFTRWVRFEKVCFPSPPPQGGGRWVTARVAERRAEQRPVTQLKVSSLQFSHAAHIHSYQPLGPATVIMKPTRNKLEASTSKRFRPKRNEIHVWNHTLIKMRLFPLVRAFFLTKMTHFSRMFFSFCVLQKYHWSLLN